LREVGQETATPEFPRRRMETLDPNKVAIGARDLNKRFGNFHAVKDVNLEVRYGQIYGLLGANGAGKTTTIKMLCGLLDPSRGAVELAGRTSDLRSAEVRQSLGYMSQKFSLYDDLTIEENLDFYAGVYGVPQEERQEKMRWVMEFSGLRGYEKQLTGSLPGGWKQRVAFGSAIMHEPSVLFLDEPTSGVDPLARRAFWRMINHLADEGTAILVTTHYLEEAEQCNKLGFMVQGELVAEGTPTEVKARQQGSLVELQTDDPQRAVAVLKSMMVHWKVSLFGNLIRVILDSDAETGIQDLRQRLEQNHIKVLGAMRGEYSLEDCFLKIVEQANRRMEEAAQ
jgi:ABC-2 type transport system ATP-binding protein